MKFAAINTSIVVAGKAHSPSLLKPQDLRAHGVVPADWQMAAPSVNTSQLSAIKFSNGISFMAESVKLIVRDELPGRPSLLPTVVENYVKATPDVYYFAVGINCDGYIECPETETWLLNRFLKRGPGNDDKLSPSCMGLKLSYPVEHGVLTLTCEVGTVQRAGETRSIDALLLSANFNIPVSEVSLDETLRAIKSFPDRIAHLAEITDSIFGLESS